MNLQSDGAKRLDRFGTSLTTVGIWAFAFVYFGVRLDYAYAAILTGLGVLAIISALIFDALHERAKAK